MDDCPEVDTRDAVRPNLYAEKERLRLVLDMTW
jgi:hypothetical protein